MAIVVLLRNVHSQLPAGLKNGVLRQCARRRASPAGQHQQIVFRDTRALARLGNCLWIIAVQTFHIIENSQATLLTERLDLVAFLAAQRTYFWNMNRNQRQSIGAQSSARRALD